MKRAFQILPAIAVIAAGSLVLAAEDKDKDARPPMSLVIIENVRPSMATQYEDATKKMGAMLTEHEADPAHAGYFCVSGPEIGYVFVIPLPEGFDSMRPGHENWMSTIESIGKDKWKKLVKKADACVESRAMIHSVYREDLSYTPKTPALKEDEVGFVQYDFLYTFPDKADAFAEIALEWRDLYESKGINMGWQVYEQITGEDLPVYLIAKFAKSEADYYAARAETMEKLGEAGRKLGEKSRKLIRKSESKAGTPRYDLSYPSK